MPLFLFLFLCLSLSLSLSCFCLFFFLLVFFFCFLFVSCFRLVFLFLSSLLLFSEKNNMKILNYYLFFHQYFLFFFWFPVLFFLSNPFSLSLFFLILSYVFCSTWMFLVFKTNSLKNTIFWGEKGGCNKTFFFYQPVFCKMWKVIGFCLPPFLRNFGWCSKNTIKIGISAHF